jgi:four helix bundle protein
MNGTDCWRSFGAPFFLSLPASRRGSKRYGSQDYARFLNIAEGSLAETEYLMMVSRDLSYSEAEDADPLLNEIRVIAGMLHNLRTRVEASKH